MATKPEINEEKNHTFWLICFFFLVCCCCFVLFCFYNCQSLRVVSASSNMLCVKGRPSLMQLPRITCLQYSNIINHNSVIYLQYVPAEFCVMLIGCFRWSSWKWVTIFWLSWLWGCVQHHFRWHDLFQNILHSFSMCFSAVLLAGKRTKHPPRVSLELCTLVRDLICLKSLYCEGRHQ